MKKFIAKHATEALQAYFAAPPARRPRLEGFLAARLAARKSLEFRQRQMVTEDVMNAVRNWSLLRHLARSEDVQEIYARSRRQGLGNARADRSLAPQTRFSTAQELLALLEASLGREQAWAAAEAQCRPAALTVRANHARISRAELVRLFIGEYRFSVRKCTATPHGLAFLAPPHVASTAAAAEPAGVRQGALRAAERELAAAL